MDSDDFPDSTIINSIKTINHKAVSDLNGERIGIIKHDKIKPTSRWFMPNREPTPAAKIEFLRELQAYMTNMEIHEQRMNQSSAERATISRSLELPDNSLKLKVLETQKEKDLLTQRIDLLEAKLEKTKQEAREAVQREKERREADLTRNGNFNKNTYFQCKSNTWGGRNQRKRQYCKDGRCGN